MWKMIAAFLGAIQAQPAVQEAEKVAYAKATGLIGHLFDWIRGKEAGHPLMQAATDQLQRLLEEHGEEELIAFLASRGIHVVAGPASKAPAQ